MTMGHYYQICNNYNLTTIYTMNCNHHYSLCCCHRIIHTLQYIYHHHIMSYITILLISLHKILSDIYRILISMLVSSGYDIMNNTVCIYQCIVLQNLLKIMAHILYMSTHQYILNNHSYTHYNFQYNSPHPSTHWIYILYNYYLPTNTQHILLYHTSVLQDHLLQQSNIQRQLCILKYC